MDTNKYNKMIDLAQMKSEVWELANKILQEINEKTLEYFANEVTKVAESCLEKYIFAVYELYTAGALRIDDMDRLEAFTDTTTGYQQQMLNWKKENAISITQKEISIPEFPQEPDAKTYHKATFGVGTIIATGIVILKHPWIALAVELLTIAASYTQYRQLENKKEAYAIKLQAYNKEIEKKKRDFVCGIIDDLEKWLLSGQAQSDKVIQSFDLQ